MKEKTLKILEDYIKRGLFLIPCKKQSKLAIHDKWGDIASNDIDQVVRWMNEFPGCNWAILPSKSGHVVLDMDMKEDPKFGTTGVEQWEHHCETHGRPDTLTARTGSGGIHAVFNAVEGQKYSGKFEGHKGVDIRFNNYIVVYPSIHESGNRYVWENESAIADLPEWVSEKLKGHKKPDSAAVMRSTSIFDWHKWLPEFKQICEELKDKDFDYLEWVKIGMSIHSMMPHEDGLQLFLIVTQGKNFVEGDVEGATYRWQGFEWGLDYGVTEKTLIWIARQKGCFIPDQMEELFDAWDIQNAYDRIKTEKDLNPEFFVDNSDRRVTVHKDFLMEYMNERYTMMTVNPESSVVSFKTFSNGVKDATVLQTDKFHTYFKNLFFKSYDFSKSKPKAKYKTASEVWIEGHNRAEKSSIVFRPLAEEHELNLWSGIPCVGVEGDVSLFIELCHDVFANGNKDKGQWFIEWCAHIVQQPDVKSTLVPVLIGDQGTGKGLFADGIMARILGPYFTRIKQSAEFKEKFNKEYSKKFLTFIDEATWRGDKTEDGIMKGLTGSDTMMVEEKFGARYSIENFSRYYIASNNMEAVAVERSNRRYMIFLVNNAYHQRKSFFKPFWDQLKKGDMAERIYFYLKNLDISAFDPFNLPHFDTDSVNAKLATEGVVAQFWNDLLNENPRPIFLKSDRLSRAQTYQEFLEFHKTSKSWEKGISQIKFWEKSEALIKILHGKQIRAWTAVGKVRAMNVTPYELFSSFCATWGTEMPEDFDDLDYLIEGDFNDQEE